MIKYVETNQRNQHELPCHMSCSVLVMPTPLNFICMHPACYCSDVVVIFCTTQLCTLLHEVKNTVKENWKLCVFCNWTSHISSLSTSVNYEILLTSRDRVVIFYITYCNKKTTEFCPHYINKIQREATVCRCLFTAKLLYMFRASIAPIIRSTSNCNCSFWYSYNLMMGAIDARNMYSNFAVNKHLHTVASRWILLI
jgi:hypothetical protein